MTRELDKNASIYRLFESAGMSIPDLDGHMIRVAERRIFWSKIAKTSTDIMPPSATPEQVAQWQAAQPAPGSELAPPPPTSQTERELAQLMQQQRSAPAPTAPAGVPAAVAPSPLPPVAPSPLPPPVTPEQVAQWNKPHTYEEWEEQIKHPQQMSPPQQPVRQQPARHPTGAAHMQRPATKQNIIQLPAMVIGGPDDRNALNYTPGPGDPNYTEASKSVQRLLKVAKHIKKHANVNKTVAGLNVMFRNCFNRAQAQNPDIQGKINLTLTIGADGSVKNVEASSSGNLGQAIECIKSSAMTANFDPPAGGASTINIPVVFVKQASLNRIKMAAGQSYEQVLAAYRASGGDRMSIGQKSKPDVTQGQYAAFLNGGSYLPPDLPETTAVEIRTAIQNGRAVGVTVLTTPPNAAINSKIDTAVRRIQFYPVSEKMDFTTTKFPPAA